MASFWLLEVELSLIYKYIRLSRRFINGQHLGWNLDKWRKESDTLYTCEIYLNSLSGNDNYTLSSGVITCLINEINFQSSKNI